MNGGNNANLLATLLSLFQAVCVWCVRQQRSATENDNDLSCDLSSTIVFDADGKYTNSK
ncbi:MAG: hypothetical protein M3222_05770 [Thermoproteota archaeon]|nr:hypothetical protein [Thermoproteota archaeon]